jgi:hypothetical protein
MDRSGDRGRIISAAMSLHSELDARLAPLQYAVAWTRVSRHEGGGGRLETKYEPISLNFPDLQQLPTKQGSYW